MRSRTEFAWRMYGAGEVEGNLHLDADSANLTAPVLQKDDQFRREMAEFCCYRGIGGGDAELPML